MSKEQLDAIAVMAEPTSEIITPDSVAVMTADDAKELLFSVVAKRDALYRLALALEQAIAVGCFPKTWPPEEGR